MRKFLKNSILEICKTMYEAHKNIKSLIEKKDFDCANIILGDCQNTAIQLGGIIEDSEGEGFVTVSFLEEYCEEIYNVSTSINENYNANKAQKSLDKILIKIENSVKNDIKVQLEIVFLPYKASMFDSLESIWRAADNDPDCNAHVIPIPYYDRKPDGSFGEMHYEGEDYPEYVPIVHYEAYKLELMKPDIIYIHNPYDGNNFVTSVDPRFYSKELKKYTDELIYIPYFVVSDIVPEHFCTLPACINSHHVIVQSDQARNTYLENYVNLTGDSRSNAEYKFLSFGSPKFDAVVNSEKTEYKIPEEWKQIICNKKVVLYNTSVGSILNGNEDYLNKLVSVLNYFSQDRDVILWWRPHPLSSAVYNSMRNHLFNSYLGLIEWYKKSAFGIYDDTPDLHRAIALSDAYYGDRSSLVALYQLTGKPVLLQNTKIKDYDSAKYDIGFEDIHDDGENLWFSAISFNGLFRMKKTDMIPEFVGLFPDERIDGTRLFSSVTESNGKLYFSPFSASAIAVYDISSGSFDRIEIDFGYTKIKEAKLYSSIMLNSRIYFIPYAYDAIICYDIENGEIIYYTDWLKLVDNRSGYQGQYFRKAAVYGDTILLPMMNSGRLLAFDTISEKFSLINGDFRNTSFHSTVIIDQKIHLCPYVGDYYSYDLEKHTVDRVNLSEYSSHDELALFSDICDCGDYFMLFPYHANCIVRIDFANNEKSAVEHKLFTEKSPDYLDDYDGKYIFAKRIADKIYAYNVEYKELVMYDINTSEWSAISLKINAKDICLYKKNAFSYVNVSYTKADETNYLENILTISDLCAYLKAESNSSDNSPVIERRASVRKKSLSNPEGNAGIKIHETIKKMVLN